MEFKEKLKRLRIENGLTQEALADAVHISRSAIAKYENGGGKPSEDTLKALAIYFGVESDELRDDEERKRRNGKKKTLWILGITLSALVIAGTGVGVGLGIWNAVKDKPNHPDCSTIVMVGIDCQINDYDMHAYVIPGIEESAKTKIYTVSLGKKYAFFVQPLYQNYCAVSILQGDCVTFKAFEGFASIEYASHDYYGNPKAVATVYSLQFSSKGAFDLIYRYEQFQNQQRFIVE
ncbi:MAG: helix-turn-helix transcriptional regulator [Bacilli bacterium]|nr:helix-turn-helix transcriptional regulator [Bacilli bacterium]